MLNKQGFDLWADQYDTDVRISEDSQSYPFAGYKRILNRIYGEIMQSDASRILDIGFGTAVLTEILYRNHHHIDGIDFSSKMIAVAKEKMPEANLMQWDFTKGIPREFKTKEYDFIVSTYALHHLNDDQKTDLIKQLLPILADKGAILIGDIAFRTREHLERCKEENLSQWDSDEFYFVMEEFTSSLEGLCHVEYSVESFCGGVIHLQKR